eukprot:Skav204993  [mRNA]  locus=scaffold4368:31051:33884:+ [translate_table: standard]
MSGAVAESIVPVAPDGALMERSAEEASLQPAVPMDPLQRLDQSMEQTSDWVKLREILERSSPFVRNTICQALHDEMARSFQNVAQQLQAFQDVVADMRGLMDSEEAVALGHLMRDIHPSNIRALQREADGIEEDTTELRSALQRRDFESLQSRASRVANKARRFRDKYAELRPKLERLQRELEKIADRCAVEAGKSEKLIAETEKRKEWWWRILAAVNVLVLVGGVVTFGGAAAAGASVIVSLCMKHMALGGATATLSAAKTTAASASATSVASIHAGIASLSTSLTASVAPFLCGGFLLLALALLGYAGRDLVKKLLGQLWAAEIEKHKRTKAAFQHMEQVVRLAAEKLGSVCEKNEALEKCLDLVVEAAEELAATAEDALVSTSGEMGREHDRLRTLVDQVCAVYSQVPQAFEELSSSLRDLEPSLQHVGQIALHPAAAFDDRGESRLALGYAGHEADPTHGQSLDIEVDQDWVLIQIQSRLLSLSPSASDCLPRNTYILVPVEEAARLGVLRAAGPNGNHVIQVENQGQSPRLLRSFRFAGSPVQHTLTGDHPLRVMASGNWIQEPASRLRVGDVVNTSNGRQEIESVNPPRASAEEVFSLDVKDGGEVYVFTPAHIGDDQLSWSGVAVLGSIQKTQRSRSTPPGYPGDPPSEGSLKCKRNARCSNICRNFKRGKCEEGTDCRFCHFSHPEEPKRQPRGPRDSSKNKTRSKSGSSQSASSQSGSGQSSTDALALDAMD